MLKRLKYSLLCMAFSTLVVGCSASTDTTEVGVRTALIAPLGKRGVQDEVYGPGSVFFFLRLISEWHVFDVALQNFTMVKDANVGSRQGDDALRFKTVDGNDITVDITISWHVDSTMAPYVLQFVGQSTEEVERKMVRPVARTVVRDILNRLTSEEYYEANRRFEMANEAKDRLNSITQGEGIVIDQVLLGEHSFNSTYEQMIRDKKMAEQEAERLISEREASMEEKNRQETTEERAVAKLIADAEGYKQRRQLEGDALLYEKQQQAAAIRIEKRAEADALIERARALSGSGGRNMVKLKVAEKLKGKKIIFVPAGSGMDFRSMDMNEFLKMYGTKSLKK
jgi:regulator of protease activity HflC (stomatin/prohibitin superfamily)